MSISIRSISENLSIQVAQEINQDSITRAKISYGLQGLIGSIVKLFVFISASTLAGVLPQALTAMTASTLLRFVSGGAHLNSFGACLMFSTFIYTSLGALSLYMTVHSWVYYGLPLVLAMVLYRDSPQDPPGKPIKTEKRRSVMKLLSMLVFALIIGAPQILQLGADLKSAVLLAVTFQVFTLTKTGGALFLLLNRLALRKGGDVQL